MRRAPRAALDTPTTESEGYAQINSLKLLLFFSSPPAGLAGGVAVARGHAAPSAVGYHESLESSSNERRPRRPFPYVTRLAPLRRPNGCCDFFSVSWLCEKTSPQILPPSLAASSSAVSQPPEPL